MVLCMGISAKYVGSNPAAGTNVGSQQWLPPRPGRAKGYLPGAPDGPLPPPALPRAYIASSRRAVSALSACSLIANCGAALVI